MRQEKGLTRARSLRVGLALPALIVAAMSALAMGLSMSAAAGQSNDDAVLKMQLELRWNNDPACWWGSLTGDINGYVAYTGDPAHTIWFSGTVIHFYEVFTVLFGQDQNPRIEPLPGESYIMGVDAGVYNLKTGFFMADGWVTDASPDYAYLIGYKYHECGVTTDPSGEEVSGEGRAFMAPP